jgi:hypothetical protein
MTPAVLSSELLEVQPETQTSGRLRVAVDALDQGTIADLPSARISEMDCDELVRVIQNAGLPFLSDETREHLVFRDRQTLERLANLARRCCLNRTTRAGSLVGTTTYALQTFDA